MEPMPSGKGKTAAEKFDEAQANRRNAFFLDMARYLGDVEARLRKEDFHRFGRALADLQKAEATPDGDVRAARDAALLIISGDEDLTRRFDDFYRSAHVVSSRGLEFERFLGGGGRAPEWRPGGKGGGSGSE